MYIPKNKIITNLYTRDKKLVYKDSQEYYTGYYWKSYDGKFFTGKNPNEKPSYELELVEPTEETFNVTTPTTKIAYTDAPTIFDDLNTEGYSEELIVEYSQLKNINLNTNQSKNLPYQFYPQPTQSDYDLGVFQRYFCVKANENIYLEINQETFNKLTSRDSNWKWELYIVFQLGWTLIGEKDQAYNANRNTVLITERRLNREGLQLFLREDYVKFWKP